MKLRQPFMHIPFLTLGVCTLLALFSMQVPPVSAESPSFVRVIHASPYVGTADVFVDGTKLLSSFAFGSVTDYVPIPAGPHHVQIALVGQGIGAAALTQTLTVAPGVAYTVAAIGATATNLALKVFIDSNQIDAGIAKLRVYHLSPNLGPVSVAASGNTLIQDVTYQQASDYLRLTAGSYTLNVDATQINMTLPLSTTLNAGTVTSVFAVGMFNGAPKLELVPAQVHGLPGVPGTGSDPNVPATSSKQPLNLWLPWLFGALAVLMLGAGVMVRRRAGER